MFDREAVQENLKQRKFGSLLKVLGRAFEITWDEVFLLSEYTEAGSHALRAESLVVREMLRRGKERLLAPIERLRKKL